MAYNIFLADRVREFLVEIPGLAIEEKELFGGLAFLVNGKMCINISGENLMCRFDPERSEEVAAKPGYLALIMKNRVMKGYCDVEPEGFRRNDDFEFWMRLCLEFNDKAKASPKKKKKK